MQFGSTSGISFSGLASGLDTNSIVSQLVNLEMLPIQRFQAQQQQLNTQRTAYGQLKSQLQNLNATMSGFSLSGAFQGTKANSSDTSIATITAEGSAPAGIFDLKVTQLASTHKVASKAYNDATTDLGLSGEFDINGTTIELESTDSLTELAAKINSADAGVTASILNGGAGKTYLTLTSKESGEEGEIAFAENSTAPGSLDGFDLVRQLGFAKDFKNPVADGFATKTFTNSADSLRTAFGLPTGGTRTFRMDGQDITVNVDTMSVDDFSTMLDGLGFKGTIVAEGAQFRLNITGASDAPVVEDASGFLAELGAITNPTTLVQARDAEFEIDGVAMTSSSNSVKDVIQGATISLVKADETKTTTLSITSDTTPAVDRVKRFRDAFNAIIDTIRNNSKFDNETFASGVLFGDSVSRQIEASLQTQVYQSVENLVGDLGNLTQIGFSTDEAGKLVLDETVLKAKLEESPDAVAELFAPRGRSANDDIVFVNGSSKAKASAPAGFAINITEAATKSTTTAAVAATDPNAGGELLTFTGGSFGTTGFQLSIRSGTTLAQLVDQINNNSTLNSKLEASIDGGKLKLTAKAYGSAASFSVVSSLAAASNTSGIGTDASLVSVAGKDVAGTINGEEATGSGQFLIGKADNATTDGLQIQYTGTATGNVGSLIYTRGVTGSMMDSLQTFLDSDTGLMSSSDKSLEDQINDLNDRIKRVQERATARESELRQRFLAMEQAIQASQAQLARMQAITSGR